MREHVTRQLLAHAFAIVNRLILEIFVSPSVR